MESKDQAAKTEPDKGTAAAVLKSLDEKLADYTVKLPEALTSDSNDVLPDFNENSGNPEIKQVTTENTEIENLVIPEDDPKATSITEIGLKTFQWTPAELVELKKLEE